MPNFCENQCSFGGPTDQIKAVFDLITTDDHKEITFNKLIPMPAILERVKKGGALINGIHVRAWIEDPGPDGKPIKRFLTAEEHAASPNHRTTRIGLTGASPNGVASGMLPKARFNPPICPARIPTFPPSS